MIIKGIITLPSGFIDTVSALDKDATVEEIELKIINQAISVFNGTWGSIKYYYGNQFVDGSTLVPPKYRLTPRERGFVFKTVNNNEPHIITEKMLRQAHPESHPRLKSILLAPLPMDERTVASVAILCDKNKKKTARLIKKLKDFGTVYGPLLKMAHKFAAEKVALKNRDKFMSFAAHELKNPLMALAGYKHLLQKKAATNKTIQLELIEKMDAEITRMKSLIDDLLDIRHSQNGELNYQKNALSLKLLLKQVAEHFKIRNPQRQLIEEYHYTNNDTVLGDEIKLSQVFINLLTNADKFSEKNKEISISLIELPDSFKISVKDKGMGIPVEEQSYIFTEFYRGSNGEKRKGIGVGLYLVKSIIAGHKGRIEVESERGNGSTFTVYLPKSFQ